MLKDNPIDTINKVLNTRLITCLLLLCIVQLFFIENKAGFSLKILLNPFVSGIAIQESLPPSVIEAQNFLSSNAIFEFALAPSLTRANNEAFFQRIIEFAYPIRLNDQSSIILDRIGGTQLSKCKLLNQPKFISVYDCTNISY